MSLKARAGEKEKKSRSVFHLLLLWSEGRDRSSRGKSSFCEMRRREPDAKSSKLAAALAQVHAEAKKKRRRRRGENHIYIHGISAAHFIHLNGIAAFLPKPPPWLLFERPLRHVTMACCFHAATRRPHEKNFDIQFRTREMRGERERKSLIVTVGPPGGFSCAWWPISRKICVINRKRKKGPSEEKWMEAWSFQFSSYCCLYCYCCCCGRDQYPRWKTRVLWCRCSVSVTTLKNESLKKPPFVGVSFYEEATNFTRD